MDVTAYLGEGPELEDMGPAVFRIKYGAGIFSAFAFDMAKSIAYMRQGNPQWANSEGDGRLGIRPDDMFARLDGTKWNDPKLDHLPQADIGARFIAEMVFSPIDMPLPRMWYLPEGVKAVVGVLGDSDGAGGEVISNQMLSVTSNDGFMSIYMIDLSIDSVDPLTVQAWRDAGHEVSVHPNYKKDGDIANPEPEKMKKVVRDIIVKFQEKFGFKPRTVRNHIVTWVGWVEQAKIERKNGIRLDAMYAHHPVVSTTMWGANPAGYLSGTGQPQRFIDEEGQVLDIYQATVHMVDEMMRTYVHVGDGQIEKSGFDDADEWTKERSDVIMPGLSGLEAFEHIRKMVEESINGYYSFLLYQWHPIAFQKSVKLKRWVRVYLFPYLKKMGIPMWSAEMILDFVDARNQTEFKDITWDKGKLAFNVISDFKRSDLTIIIPAQQGGLELEDIVADKTRKCDFWIDSIFGRNYAVFVASEAPVSIEAYYR